MLKFLSMVLCLPSRVDVILYYLSSLYMFESVSWFFCWTTKQNIVCLSKGAAYIFRLVLILANSFFTNLSADIVLFEQSQPFI